MGSTMSGSGNKSHDNLTNKTNRINQNSPNPSCQHHHQQQQPAQIMVKTPQEKCEDVQNELNELEKEVNEFNGKKNDKLYLKLEELLTRCLLRLDEIDRGDERINQMRKKLINFVHELTDKLERLASLDNETSETSQHSSSTNQNGLSDNHNNHNDDAKQVTDK